MERAKSVRSFLINWIILAYSITASSASLTDSLLTQGNGCYLKKQFQEAVQCYLQIEFLGYESGDLYYNLGNAYYKQGKYANAILYYEKALKLKPGDADIQQNLKLANAHIIDRINAIPDFFLVRWKSNIRDMLSPDQWAPFSIVLLVCAALGFAFYFVSRRPSIKKMGFASGVFMLFLSVLSLTFMLSRIHNIKNHESAIIMSPVVNARSSPDEQSTNVFVLHEGSKVIVTDSVQNWKEIRIANGNKGWVPDEMLGSI